MAQYFTDFSEYATGSGAPSGWTGRWVATNITYSIVEDAGVTGGKHLRLVRTSSGRSLLSWDVIDADADRATVEVLARVRRAEVGSDNNGGMVVRGSGAAGSETGYVGDPICRATPSTNRVRINEYASGTFGQLANAINTWSTNTWYWTRWQASGTALKIRRWAGAIGDEPGTWDVETTDATTSAAGWVGAFLFFTGTFDFDVFGVGTNGDAAPSEAVGGGAVIVPKLMQLAA